MKKISVYFICLVMVGGLFSCVSTDRISVVGPENNLPVGKIALDDFFIDLGISPDRWEENPGYTGGYSRGSFPGIAKAYYFPDKKKLIQYITVIFNGENERNQMSEERFLSLVQTELEWYYRRWGFEWQDIDPVSNTKVGKAPALFTTTMTRLSSDGRNQQISFAGLVHKKKEILLILVNHRDDPMKDNHLDEVKERILPQIVFQEKPFDNIS